MRQIIRHRLRVLLPIAVALSALPALAPAQTAPEAAAARAADADLVDADLVAAGARAYARRCASCHGEQATSGASGDIRGLDLSIVVRAIRGVEQMPEVAVRPGEAEAIAAWLAVAP